MTTKIFAPASINAGFYLSLAFILTLFACNNNGFEGNENKSVFRYNESSGILTLDPAFAKDQAHTWITNQIFNSLVQADDELKVKPSVAKYWEISEDGKTYTFVLRNDVCFHDHHLFTNGKGRKVIAGDFEYSLKRLKNPDIASPGAWTMDYVAAKDNELLINALNDSTLKITLSKPFPPFLSILAMQYCSVVPEEIVQYYGRDFRRNPVGTGPFKFQMWKEGVKLVLLKNPYYFEYDGQFRLPYLDAVAVTFVVDKQTAFLEFIKGNLDILSGIDAGYKDELLTGSGRLNPKYHNRIKMISQPYLNTEYLGFLVDKSLDNNPLAEKKIRQAINYGFDRVRMMRYLRNNIGHPGVHGFIPLGMPGADISPQGYNYNPDKARRLLREAGYPNGKDLPEIKLSTTSSYLDICEFIQHQLAEIGIKLKIEVNQAATLRSMIAKSEVPFFRGSWIADYPDAENYLMLFYSPNFCPRGSNYTHFSNPDFDALYEKAIAETNDSLRFKLYYKMDEIIIEEAPVVVLYYDRVLRFVKYDIEGIGSNPINLLDLRKVRKTKKAKD